MLTTQASARVVKSVFENKLKTKRFRGAPAYRAWRLACSCESKPTQANPSRSLRLHSIQSIFHQSAFLEWSLQILVTVFIADYSYPTLSHLESYRQDFRPLTRAHTASLSTTSPTTNMSEGPAKSLWLNAPLIQSKHISALLGANVYLKLDVSVGSPCWSSAYSDPCRMSRSFNRPSPTSTAAFLILCRKP